jgi:uncharacterized protein (TIGR02145 family)
MKNNTNMKINVQTIIISIGLAILFCCCRLEKEIPIPPEAVLSYSPDSINTTTIVRFDCSHTKPGNKEDELYFRWDWDNNGTWDEEYTNDPVFMHRFFSKGLQKIRLQVLNSSGLTDTTHLSIDVARGYSPPRAMFLVTPVSGNRITEFTFDATLTVDDEDSLDQLKFRWDWNGDEIWDTGFSSTSLVKHAYYETGSFHPTLEVRDPTGRTDIYRQSLEVNQTNPDLHVEFTWRPLHPLQEDSVLFDASLCYNPDDPDNELLYYWKFDLGEPLKSTGWLGPFQEPTITHVFTMEFEYGVTLKIIDKNSLEKQLTQPVSVYHLNRPPNPNFKIGQKQGNLTTQFYLDAWLTTDIEDLPSAIKVRWDFEGDQIWDTEFSEDKYQYHRFSRAGVYKIVLQAMDTEGLRDTISTYVTVTPGTNETGLIIDRRFDAEEFYPTVKIGDQWWTAKNMAYEPFALTNKIDTTRSFCYKEEGWSPRKIAEMCKKYGRLYTAYSASDMKMWEGVQGICPKGWHIPTRKEWETLIETIGGYLAATELLPGGSTDFNALFGGWGHEVMIHDPVMGDYKGWEFIGQEQITYFWASTPLKPAPPAYSHWNIALLKGEDRIYTGYSGNANFISVRCIRNE